MQAQWILGCLASAIVAQAQPQTLESPNLRHVNIVALEAGRGTAIEIGAACVPHGDYQDSLRCRLVRPDGYVAAEKRFARDESGVVSVAADWDGRCALEASCGWNLATLTLPEALPHAYLCRSDGALRTIGPWGPLHFWVPPDAKAFEVFIQADVTGEGLHATIRNPQGQVAWEEDGDFDARTKVPVTVPDGQAGAAWSIEIAKPTGPGLGLDDVWVELGPMLPPFLTPKPEWAELFAKGWAPETGKPISTRLQPTPATLPPFKGVQGPDIERAYTRTAGEEWRTSLPFTYVLDYGPKHLDNPEYVPAVSTAPPTLLHLGKDVPLNHGWGPIKALGGENQAYGTDEYIQRITPEEVAQRIDGLRAMVDDLHAGGVRWVTPYVCGMTLDGDADRRTGFWGFYDHWDEYLPLGLAPRPKPDPFEWLQRNADGTPHQYYRYNYPAEYYPPFKTNHRYAACWRREGWPQWLSEVIRFAAKCGYDGVFVDNSCSQRCQCDVCLAAFRKYLKDQYPPERAKELFGDVSLEEVTWPTARNTPLAAETNRFWCETLAQEMATLKRVGTEALGREFIIFPNGGVPVDIQRGLASADFVMFEKSTGDYGTNPGVALCPLFEGVKLRAYNDSIFELKFVQGLHARVRPIILSRGGYPRELPHLVLNPNTARLGMAECGAFSGGGGFLIGPNFGVFHDALNEYRRFFESHPDLYAGLDTYAQAAVLVFPEQSWLGNSAQMSAAEALTGELTEAHVLFDYVSELRFSDKVLKPYPTVVAPNLQVLSDEQLRTLAEYVKAGGHLVISGRFAELDDALKSRDLAAGEWGPVTELNPGETMAWGNGTLTKCATLEEARNVLAGKLSVMSGGNPRLAPHVKLNAFRSVGGSPRIIVHVVNYNVPLGVPAEDPQPVEGLSLTVPLPKGMARVEANSFAPEEGAPTKLTAAVENGKATVQLPRLTIYQVVEIKG